MKKDKYFGFSKRIVKWKINNPFENWLSFKADGSDLWKRFYVLYYRLLDPKYYEGGVKLIKALRNEYSYLFNVPQSFLIRDMVYCLHRFGASFEDYCIYHFIDKTPKCRNTFVTDKLRHYYADILNAPHIAPLLDDKYKCYEVYREFYGRDVCACYSGDDLGKFIDFTKKHTTFIVKPIAENCGHGVRFIDLKDIDENTFFKNTISNGAFIIEEPIAQGTELKALHPESVNTLRVSTFVLNEEVLINAATLRIGAGPSIVDNAGSGGMYASVDFENGIVQTNARTYLGKEYNIHPDTQVQIVGYKLPDWKRLLETVTSIAKKEKGTNMVAWDLAWSEKGWIMVEGNAVGSWDLLQSNKQIGLKPMLFQRMDKFFEAQ